MNEREQLRNLMESITEAGRPVQDPDNRNTFKGEVLPSLKDEPTDNVGLDVDTGSYSMDNEIENDERKQLLLNFINELSKDKGGAHNQDFNTYAQILYSHFFKGMSVAEIAIQQGVKPLAVQMKLTKAVRIFRNRI